VSAPAFVRCAGAPRDLGLDQGAALRAAVQGAALRAAVQGAALHAAARRALHGRRAGRAAQRIARDIERFFPHHAERTQGISLGARVPAAALAGELAALLAGDAGLAAAAGGLVARSIPVPAGSLVLRESLPDNDYRSLELASAWSAAAWIGVNEHGLAASATALPATEASLAGCAAPAQLLVQDVLQRFDSVEKALDWALRRPAGGHASLLVADASGSSGAVEVDGRLRRTLGAGEPVRIGLGPEPAAAALAKALAEARAVDAERLARALAEATGGAPLVAVADPAGRRLGLARPGAALAWHALAPR
jgi:hypothetical protein